MLRCRFAGRLPSQLVAPRQTRRLGWAHTQTRGSTGATPRPPEEAEANSHALEILSERQAAATAQRDDERHDQCSRKRTATAAPDYEQAQACVNGDPAYGPRR